MDVIIQEAYPEFFTTLDTLFITISETIESPQVEPILNQLQYIKDKVALIFNKSKMILFPHLKDSMNENKNIHLLDQLITDLNKMKFKLGSFIKEIIVVDSSFSDTLDEVYQQLKQLLDLNKQLYASF